MPRTAGIPLVDLFDLTDRANSALPNSVQDFIDQFAVVNHRSRRSDGAIFHVGDIRALDESTSVIPSDFNIGIGRLSLPLLQTGIPFQLAFPRSPGTTNLEPLGDLWRLDLSLDAFTLVTDKLEPAIYVPESSTTPRHLVRDTLRDTVRITGSAVLRIERDTAADSVTYRFIDQPDPLDPQAVSGAVTQVIVSPPHFFIGGSEFGLSVGKLLFDASDSFSPPDVLERAQGPGWEGVLIREATFYAPRNLPGVGDLSGGVRNVLLGSPAGLQGELEIQFGRTALNPAAFQFEQVTPTGRQALLISGDGNSRFVTLEGAQSAELLVHAGFVSPGPPTDGSLPAGALQDWKAYWIWDELPPPGQPATSVRLEEGDSASGTVRHGMELSVTPIEVITVDEIEQEFEHPAITFRFIASGTAPRIDATVGAENFTNAVHLGGPEADIKTVQLNAVSAASGSTRFTWQIGNRSERIEGPSLDLATIDNLPGHGLIVLREKVSNDDERVSRIQWQFLEEQTLLIGCEAGVFEASDDGAALALSAAEVTVDLSDFHAQGEFDVIFEQAELDPADNTRVIVPADGLAQVVIDPGTPTILERDRHVQILMHFDTTDINRWGDAKPAGTPGAGAYSQSDLLAWANRYPGADFVVVGRCGDIGSVQVNRNLAVERARRGEELLTVLDSGQTGTVIDGSRVLVRGEQSAFTGDNAAGDSHEEDSEIALTAAEKSESVSDAALNNGWLILSEQDNSTWPTQRSDDLSHPAEITRANYRRIDIYAVGGSPTNETALRTDEETLKADKRRSLVPAAGRDLAPAPPGTPAIDYRVKLKVTWESPTVTELKDAIPTLAEAEFAWTPQQAPLPLVNGSEVELSREVLTIFANWVHDARTGYTKATLGIKSEGDDDGLISTSNKTLSAALAFGPALLSGVNSNTEVVESGARIAALLVGVALAEQDLGGGDTFIATGSKTSLLSAAFETEMRSISDPGPDMQLRVVTDYVCTLHINGGVFGIKTVAGSPLKIRYKNAGIEYDTSANGWERFGLVYDTTALEIEDPGRWEIDGVLGQLLRIVEVAMGRGSIWFEARIAIALDIGIVEITEAIIRLTFHDGSPIPEFELRGFVVRTNIPGVLEGEGRLRIENGGVIRAGIDATVVPLKLSAQAGIALGKPPEIDPSVFLELFLGVQFATPLPLAQSGMAIYGFKGLFVMNGQRKLGSNPDPVGRELDWWRAPPGNKYEPEKGQYALGVGVVVGTLPDVSFCVSCAGMVVVAFPDPEVILGVDVNIIEVPDTTVTDEGGASGTITGLIVIDDEAVKLAVSAQYTIPELLEVHVPFSGFFPYPGSGKNVYVRIGSDGQTAFERYGQPVTLRLLPSTLDIRAWTYLMIEEGGLPNLGGDERFSFDGFSVGWGAGWDINWSAGPIKLSASAKVLVGFGTAPLMIKGGVFVNGELDLVVVSISARGELILELRENPGGSPANLVRVSGEFCGEVDLFFFSISGCVGVSFGNELSFDPPPPPSPVRSVSLTDRHDRIMGTGTTGTPAAVPVFNVADPSAAAAVDDNHTVWPDTAPIIHFNHYVEDAFTGGQFSPTGTVNPPKWWGSNGLKYAYRIDSIELRRSNGTLVSGDEPLQSVWTTTPYRQPNSSGETAIPSEHEGPNLKLLDWNPWAWVVNMEDGGASQPGDPVDTIEDICDSTPVPTIACVLGKHARRKGINRVRMRQRPLSEPPYPSRFHLTGEPVLRIDGAVLTGRAVQQRVEDAGGHMVAGSITDLPFDANVLGAVVNQAYRLPAARVVRNQSLRFQTLPWEGRFDRKVSVPVVLLMVCTVDGVGDDTGGGGNDDKVCEDFRRLSPGESLSGFEHNGIGFRAISPRQQLHLVDDVDQRSEPAAPGSDNGAEIRFPNDGVEIIFKFPCDRVEVHVMQFAGPVKGDALSASGRVLDSESTPNQQRVPHVMVFNGDAQAGVSRIQLFGGSGEAVVFRICCSNQPAQPPTNPEEQCEDFAELNPNNQQLSEATHGNFSFSVIDPDSRLRLTDQVDQSASIVRPGQDGRADINFPEKGVLIKLKRPCRQVTVHLMRFHQAPVQGIARDTDGKQVASASAAGAQQRAQQLVFRAQADGKPVADIILNGGSGEAAIYRICCSDAVGTQTCIDFSKLDRFDGKVDSFSHGGITFTSGNQEKDLALVDLVDAKVTPEEPGQDDVPELLFTDNGVRLVFRESCEAVSIAVMLFAGEPVHAVASNRAGRRIDKDSTTTEPKVAHRLQLAGKDIRSVELTGGGNESVLIEVCCRSNSVPLPDVIIGRPGGLSDGLFRPAVDADTRFFDFADNPFVNDVREVAGLLNSSSISAAASTTKAVRVRGIVDQVPFDDWPGTVIDSQGDGKQRCQLIAYSPRSQELSPWHGFQIAPPDGVYVSVVAVCGVDQAAIDAREDDIEAQQELEDTIDEISGSNPNERREIVLQPGELYEIAIEWSWQAFQPDEPDDTPPEPDAGAWQGGGTEVYEFRVASDTTVADSPQDGLNEYQFDARDISRYLIGVEPADGRSFQFTDDPIWIHFDNGHIEQLLEQYGRTLEIEVRRTDPPPQPTTAALDAVLAPLEIFVNWHVLADALQPTGYQRLNEAILAAPCLDDGAPMGGASLAVDAPLEPDADYDLRVLAPRSDNSDQAVVLATRFHTSRFDSPRSLIDALGFAPGLDGPFLPDDHVLFDGMHLPVGEFSVSDGELDLALDAVDAVTLPLPTRKAKTTMLWRFSGGQWQVEAMLLDSLEPLKRERTVVVTASPAPTVGVRCQISHATIGSTRLELYRSNANWTRVMLKPAVPLTLAANVDHTLAVHFDTSDGVLSGGRRLRSIPAIIEREGL